MSIIVYCLSQGGATYNICHLNLGKIGFRYYLYANLEGVLVYSTRKE